MVSSARLNIPALLLCAHRFLWPVDPTFLPAAYVAMALFQILTVFAVAVAELIWPYMEAGRSFLPTPISVSLIGSQHASLPDSFSIISMVFVRLPVSRWVWPCLSRPLHVFRLSDGLKLNFTRHIAPSIFAIVNAISAARSETGFHPLRHATCSML